MCNRNRLHLIYPVEADVSLNNVLSSSVGINSSERLHIKGTVEYRLPSEPPNRPPTKWPRLVKAK
ncbi:unnamed protein product [Hymenolepis diminuta]|uniref:Uncharacterized protein n=1 Tax=Hymenolepis diminuta TaxID=6216 RepID=A0A564XY56_HYMDI|nr:unnamed protein product [Hymenolepis diminuta]